MVQRLLGMGGRLERQHFQSSLRLRREGVLQSYHHFFSPWLFSAGQKRGGGRTLVKPVV